MLANTGSTGDGDDDGDGNYRPAKEQVPAGGTSERFLALCDPVVVEKAGPSPIHRGRSSFFSGMVLFFCDSFVRCFSAVGRRKKNVMAAQGECDKKMGCKNNTKKHDSPENLAHYGTPIVVVTVELDGNEVGHGIDGCGVTTRPVKGCRKTCVAISCFAMSLFLT